MDIASLSMNMANMKLAQGFTVGMYKMAMEQTEQIGALMSETMSSEIVPVSAPEMAEGATVDFRV